MVVRFVFISIVEILFCAWFLALFGFDDIIIRGFKTLFGLTIDKPTYYFIWVAIVVIAYVIHFIKD